MNKAIRRAHLVFWFRNAIGVVLILLFCFYIFISNQDARWTLVVNIILLCSSTLFSILYVYHKRKLNEEIGNTISRNELATLGAGIIGLSVLVVLFGLMLIIFGAAMIIVSKPPFGDNVIGLILAFAGAITSGTVMVSVSSHK